MAKFGRVSKAAIKEGITDPKIKDEDVKDRYWGKGGEGGGKG